MAVEVFYRGDDIKKPIWGYEDDGTTPLNIDNLLDIIIRVWVSPFDVLKYSKTDKTAQGYVQLERESATKYWLIIEGSVTASMKIGDINIDTMVIITDTQLSDSRLNESASDILGTLKDSTNKSEL